MSHTIKNDVVMQGDLEVTGDLTVNNQLTNTDSSTIIGTTDAAITGNEGAINSQGDIILYKSGGSVIAWPKINAPPTFATRSTGTKLVLNGSNFNGSDKGDYAIGTDANSVWHSLPQVTTTYFFNWYAGETNIMKLRADGPFTITRPTAGSGLNSTAGFIWGGASDPTLKLDSSPEAAGGAEWRIGSKYNANTLTIESLTNGALINLGDSTDRVDVAGDLDIGGCLTFTSPGSVTQLTSISTGVTLNNCVGKITTVSSTLGAGSSTEFTVTNSVVTTSSSILLSMEFNGNGSPYALIKSVSSGSFIIRLRNNGTSALNSSMKISFFVII